MVELRPALSGPVFSAVLRPNRSATVAGLNAAMLFVGGVFCVTGIGFGFAGAWPVTGLLGLDIGLLYLALRWNLRAADRFEAIVLVPRALTVERVDAWGRRSLDVLEPGWLQVAHDPDRGRLELRARGQGIAVGGFLAPEERAELAAALRAALARVRAPEALGYRVPPNSARSGWAAGVAPP